jgi:serine/threonine-protein kinase
VAESPFVLTQRTMPVGAGSRLGAWEIVSPLGEGGMCETFVVRHAVAGGRAVAKVLRPELAVVDGVGDRLEREAQILAAIDHPNVVRLFDAGRLDDRPFLIIEWAGALDLDARMKKAGGAIGTSEAVWIFRSVLSALERVHALGIVHRDLKPSNIFLPDAPNGLVKLSDFGVSRQESSRFQTQAGAFYGTPVFMSPEQAQGKSIDARSDLFSLASTIYAALTGRPPFHAETAVKVLMRIVQEEANPPVGLVDPIPPELSDLLLVML